MLRNFPKLKSLISIFLPTIATITLIGIGFFMGRYVTTLPFKQLIDGQDKERTIGKLLGNTQNKDKLLECYEGEIAPEALDTFSWAPPSILVPFLGHAPWPGKHDNAIINSMHMRSEEEVISPKPKNIYRIFIIGGSTAYGSGASGQERTIGGFLRETLNKELSPITNYKYEVFTLAYPAWVSTHERIAIENILSELEPDAVISFSGNNDVHWSGGGSDILQIGTYSDQTTWKLVDTVYKMVGHDLMIESESEPEEEIASMPPQLVAPQVVTDKLIKNIKLSSYALSMVNAKYIFALQPTLAVTQKKLTSREKGVLAGRARWQREYFKLCYTALAHRLEMSDIKNFHFINMADVFNNLTERDEVFLDSYHFGDKGNKIIAKKIFIEIRPFFEKDGNNK